MRHPPKIVALVAVVLVIVVAVLVVGLTTGGTSHASESCHHHDHHGCSAPTTNAQSSSTTGGRATTSTTTPSAPRLDDGSLGFQGPRIACTLLNRAEIETVFHAPVSVGATVYPDCQWLIGSSTWLGLQVDLHTSFNTATQWVDTFQTVRGLGQQAIVANDHILYFTSSGTTYGLSVQTPSNFEPNYDVGQLVTLGHEVLAHGLPSHQLGPRPMPAAAGPPIYFAGDSTAAGPEWAYWQYYADQATGSPTRALYEYQVGTGFVRYNFFDWPRHLLAEAAEWRPKLVIFMGSANDDQNVVIGGKYYAFGTPGWIAAYRASVGSTMASLLREGCKVLWIGEPAMSTPSMTAAMRVIDGVYSTEAAAHPGVTFVNPGTWLDGPHGTYKGVVNLDGHVVPAFLDGVHLNTAGSQFFARVIARYVNLILGIKRR